MEVIDSSANEVRGNLIGTDRTGTIDLGNFHSGVFLYRGAHDNIIGGTTAAQRNLISGNDIQGVSINGDQGPPHHNIVLGNYIGTDAAGAAAIGNSCAGIGVGQSSHSNVISGNLISGNINPGTPHPFCGPGTVASGIGLFAGATNNSLLGNLIGTDASGMLALANQWTGIDLNNAPGNLIGGADPGERNVVSGNLNMGITLGGGSNSNIVEGNYIGTNIAGTGALANGDDGIFIWDSSNNTIGGLAAARNVISGNVQGGVNIFANAGATSSNNLVGGNFIGTDSTGSAPLGNGGNGVEIHATAGGNANNNWVGASFVAEGNLIALNGGSGIWVSNATQNRLLSNAIGSNGQLGIDLAPSGVAVNDPLDADAGANNQQNFPVLTSAVTVGANTNVAGSLQSTPSTAFTVEFFSNPSCDASSNGEGRTFLGFLIVNTDAGGATGPFARSFPALTLGSVVTATATDAAGNTSEFSACVPVIGS
jgi:titin